MVCLVGRKVQKEGGAGVWTHNQAFWAFSWVSWSQGGFQRPQTTTQMPPFCISRVMLFCPGGHRKPPGSCSVMPERTTRHCGGRPGLLGATISQLEEPRRLPSRGFWAGSAHPAQAAQPAPAHPHTPHTQPRAQLRRGPGKGTVWRRAQGRAPDRTKDGRSRLWVGFSWRLLCRLLSISEKCWCVG